MTEGNEPDFEALVWQRMDERQARLREIFERAQRRPAPATIEDIEAEFERVRNLLGPPEPPEPPRPLPPEQEALAWQRMEERQARLREIFERAQHQTAPAITDEDIEAEFERVRKLLAEQAKTDNVIASKDSDQPELDSNPGSGRDRVE